MAERHFLAWREPARRALADGGVVAYPTEAVYGLGCDPADAAAVARVLRMKRRSPAKGLILLAAEADMLTGWVTDDALASETVRETWPGPVTWILPAGPLCPPWIRGAHEGVAVRVSAHPVAAALSRAWGGPLVSTSANRDGRKPARSALGARLHLGRELAWLVPGATGGTERPTTIRRYPDGAVLRA